MNEEKDQEGSALDEIMVARIEIEGIGVAANEKEMIDCVRALPGVREVKIENGAMHVTYDPLATSEKKIEEAVRASGNTVKAATADTETPHPGERSGRNDVRRKPGLNCCEGERSLPSSGFFTI